MPCYNNTSPTYQAADAIKDLEAAIRAAETANQERREELKRQRWSR